MITPSGASTGASLESELFSDGDEDRRTRGRWKGEIAWPGLVVGRGLDLSRFQFDVEEDREHEQGRPTADIPFKRDHEHFPP
jgi:hypothetical protein